MRRLSTRQRQRSGFSLIELLVVIAIIATLIGLLLAGVMPVLNKGPKLQTINEIRQLQVALDAFNADFKTYPPSRIILSNDPKVYFNAPPGSLQQESLAYLQRIWPRIDWTKGVDWGADLLLGQPFVILQGDQCLVFFLGGMQQPSGAGSNGCLGFATDPYNPTTLPKVQGEVRKGPYFNFDNTRLVRPDPVHAPTLQARPGPPFTQGAYVYMDYYGAMPYAYFSSLKGPNLYSLAILSKNVSTPGDCPSLNVSPYMKNGSPPFQFYNPDTFQILSAGKDTVFGAMTIVAPGTAPPTTLITYTGIDMIPRPGSGSDDLSNFASGELGAGL
jgi:prepilin-type N-terminal cleavage/methylation domain-containing protein